MDCIVYRERSLSLKTLSSLLSLRAQVLVLSVSICLMSGSTVFAATLGDMEILSGPGEYLRAEVPIYEVDSTTEQTLVASVADEALSQAAGLTQSESLPFLWPELRQREDGSWYLTLLSSESMPNEFNEIILELTWQNGSYLREYALSFEGSTRTTQRIQTTTQTPSTVTDSQANPSRVQVNKGDSLLSIVRSLSFSDDSGVGDDSVSRPETAQIMFAIYSNNPTAFAGSPDKLRAGITLDIPAVADIAATDITQARALFSTEASRSTSAAEDVSSNGRGETLSLATTLSSTPQVSEALQERDTSIPLYVTASSVSVEGATADRFVDTETQQTLDQIQRNAQKANQRLAGLDESVGTLKTQLVDVEESIVSLDSVVEQTNKRVGGYDAQLDALRAESADLQLALTAESPDAVVIQKEPSTNWSERINNVFKGSDYRRSLMLLGLAIFLAFGLVARQLLVRRKGSIKSQHDEVISPLVKENSQSSKTAETTVQMKPNDKMKTEIDSDQSASLKQQESTEPSSALAWFSEHLQSAKVSDDALTEALRGLPNRQDLRLRLMQRYAQQKDVTRFAMLGQEMFRMTRGRNPEWPEVIQLALALELEMQVVQGETEGKVRPVRLAEHLDLTLDRTAV